ncbi:hypothetical protein CO653_10310 [Rhizobium anhuiense]|uniref:hypothetical protein n=1 Tax=Rhizobium anhuiense TaxID=1184720 RepID=UPI000BEDC94F|nr:hypothetical protein [Rhizobium anhuiense]PDS66158.1 hypothetical protein CO653_10310 [Rhizobium anhuiense]
MITDVNVLDRTADEMDREEIIGQFADGLWNDNGASLAELHFGCNADQIEWDDKDFSHMEFVPAVTVAINIAEITEGRFDRATCETLHRLFFVGPHHPAIKRSLMKALAYERERVAQETPSEEFLSKIRKHLLVARMGVQANFRAEFEEFMLLARNLRQEGLFSR